MSLPNKPTGFNQFNLSKPLEQALTEVGYEEPTPIQTACIPEMLQGKDIVATAQTGTGKTAAFALPLLEQLSVKDRSPQALILAPTRELAIQVATALQSYATFMRDVKILPVYGGQGMDTQLRQLKKGVHIVVGTPGRVLDHLRRNTLKLHLLNTIVLDEADEMLRMGFIDDVEWILEHTPEDRQTALFSATMPAPIRKIAENYMQSPQHIAIKSETKTVSTIKQSFWLVQGTSKIEALCRIVDSEVSDGIVVFVRTKNSTVEVADKLIARGLNAAAINGDMNQSLREKTVEKLRNGKIDILVATDVVARGIDVARVSHIFNFDMPYDSDVYIHRIGRTGRAGRAGRAILFVAPRERRLLRAIENHTKQIIEPINLPSNQQVKEQQIDRFKQEIQTLMQQPIDQKIAMLISDLQRETEADWQHIAVALVTALHQKKPIFAIHEKKHKSEETQDGNKKNDSQDKSRGEKSRRDNNHDDNNNNSRRKKTYSKSKRSKPQ